MLPPSNNSNLKRRSLMPNRPRPGMPMDDDQRKAMFARMHGRGSGSGRGRGTSQNGLPGLEPGKDGKYHATLNDGTDVSAESEEALDQKLALIRDAGGIHTADSDALIAGIPGAGGLMSALGPLGRVLASWKTPLASALAAMGLDKYREEHPDMDPRDEKVLAIAEQLAGYISAISALSTGKDAAANALDRVPVGSSSALGVLSTATAKVGDLLNDLGKAIGNAMPDALKGPLEKLYKGYTTVADYTGASITDLGHVGELPAKFKSATSLEKAAAETYAQAAEIEKLAATKGEALTKQAYYDLMASHKASLAFDPEAQAAYKEAAANFWDAKGQMSSSASAADQMRKAADKMMEKAGKLKADATAATIKAALVAGGFAAKEVHEEHKVRSMQQEMEDAFAKGENYTIPAEKPRGPLETALAMAVGTLGNPIEKQTRYGQSTYNAQVAYYRTQYDMIGKAEQSGELSPAEANDARLKLAQSKPQNMAGKGAWTFAPASAAFLSWQAGEIADTMKRTEIDRRTPGSYIDGDTINFDQHHGENSVRLLDINAPEVPHAGMHDPNHPERTTGEPLGKEAAVYAAKLVAGGQYVRLKSDSHPKAAGTDVHGRTLATVETLPKPFDQLLRVPVVGKLIPAKEFQTEMIKAGLADTAYRQLSGPTDVGEAHDKARSIAQADGKGIWAPDVKEQLPWVGKEKTVQELRRNPSAPQPSNLGTALGSGLMVTGQSGVFKTMGASGNVAAQTWNAALAVLGAREFNQKASARPGDIVYRPPKAVKTRYETDAQQVLDERRRRK